MSATRSPSCGRDAQQARDAAEAIEVDYDVLPAATDLADRNRTRPAAGLGERTQQHLLRLACRRCGKTERWSSPPRMSRGCAW